jgi:hypothetical protein
MLRNFTIFSPCIFALPFRRLIAGYTINGAEFLFNFVF